MKQGRETLEVLIGLTILVFLVVGMYLLGTLAVRILFSIAFAYAIVSVARRIGSAVLNAFQKRQRDSHKPQ